MKKIILMCLYLLSILHGQECLETNSIKNQIIHIDDNEDKVVLMRLNGEILTEIKFLNFIDVEERMFYKDLNFDNKEEILINISSHEKREEYKVLSIECNKLTLFSPHTLHRFKLDKKNKKILEHISSDNENRPMLNSFCLHNNQYYICESEESFSANIKRINEFNFQKKIVATYYYFNSNVVELKKTIDKKILLN